MLDIKYIRENVEEVKQNIKNRGVKVDIDELLFLDKKRREGLQEVESYRSTRKQSSKGGKPTEEEITKMREVGDKIKELEKEQDELEKNYKSLLLQIPNKTHKSSPVGGEGDFKVLETRGKVKEFDFKPKTHFELMENLDLIDFERGAKVAGSKFYFSKNELVRINFALISYGIDIASKHGFELVETPDIAKNDILEGVGFNPRGEETQIYSIENTDLSLIGTAEITMGGYHSGEVLDLEDGPKKYLAVSHCFRTEAGAYGKASKGLYRVHQFTKLEMFICCKPEESEKLHKEILEIEKEICDGLEIPYQVIDIATGDLGGPAYRKFDIEANMTMLGDDKKQSNYGEITSTSNCTDYQSRCLNIKYKNSDGTNEFVHTLNGTAVVLSRFPIALIENHQQKDGSIKIPKKLRKYCGFKEIKVKK